MTVVGLDLSLQATGFCRLVEGGTPELASFKSTGTLKDTVAMRAERLATLMNDIVNAVGHPRLVVIEGPSVMSKGGSNWDRAGLWWHVVGELRHMSLPVASVPPTSLKKWATGKGNADKAAVALGVARLFPDVEFASSDEADALGLAAMGGQRLGYSVPVLARHREVLVKIEWPTGMELAA